MQIPACLQVYLKLFHRNCGVLRSKDNFFQFFVPNSLKTSKLRGIAQLSQNFSKILCQYCLGKKSVFNLDWVKDCLPVEQITLNSPQI